MSLLLRVAAWLLIRRRFVRDAGYSRVALQLARLQGAAVNRPGGYCQALYEI